jgi:hypothetical protein
MCLEDIAPSENLGDNKLYAYSNTNTLQTILGCMYVPITFVSVKTNNLSFEHNFLKYLQMSLFLFDLLIDSLVTLSTLINLSMLVNKIT